LSVRSIPPPARGAALRRRARVAGLTLIEVLVAMALSFGVLGAIGYVYVEQRVTQRRQEDLAQVQGAARLALERIGRDVRQAGFIGCNSALQRHTDKLLTETAVVPLYGSGAVPTDEENFTIDASNALRVFDSSASAVTWGGSRPSNVVAGTHVLEVRYATAEGATRLSGPLPANGIRIPTMGRFDPSGAESALAKADHLGLLTDCQSAMVVSVMNSNATQALVRPTLPIDFSRCGHASRVGAGCVYWPTAMLMPLRVVQYYVADLGAAERPDRRLMSRTRVMTLGSIVWDTPQTLAQGVLDLRAIGAGLDTPFPADVQWRAVRFVDELVDGGNAVASLPASDWPRLVRLDLRLSMQADRPAGTPAIARPPIRNFEASYTVRTRAHPDPT
jgi:type II secretory pathway pseudopilin PulG